MKKGKQKLKSSKRSIKCKFVYFIVFYNDRHENLRKKKEEEKKKKEQEDIEKERDKRKDEYDNYQRKKREEKEKKEQAEKDKQYLAEMLILAKAHH